MRTFHKVVLGFGMAAASHSFAAITFQCKVSDPDYARIGEVFTVIEDGKTASLTIEHVRNLGTVLVRESAESRSPVVGTVTGSLAPHYDAQVVSKWNAVNIRVDLTGILTGFDHEQSKFVLELSHPVAPYSTFAANIGIWQEFANGRRVRADARLGNASRTLENLLDCERQ